MASSIIRIAAAFGRIPPEAFDAIFPHGPVLSHRAAELNPQPLPPNQQLLVASAAVAHDIAFAAVSAEAAGTGSAATARGRPGLAASAAPSRSSTRRRRARSPA